MLDSSSMQSSMPRRRNNTGNQPVSVWSVLVYCTRVLEYVFDPCMRVYVCACVGFVRVRSRARVDLSQSKAAIKSRIFSLLSLRTLNML